jgi:hypothetical protein
MFKFCVNKSTLETLFTVGIFLLFFGILGGTLRLWSSEGSVLVPAGSWVTMIGLLFLGLSLYQHHAKGINRSQWTPNISHFGVVISFLICFFSDWTARTYSFPKAPEIRGEVFFFTALVITALWHRKEKFLFSTSLVISSVCLIFTFLSVSKGNFLYSDDHSVVVYRLSLLKENFPFIPFYNPFWNMGLDARDFFATGVLNLFTLWAPLIYLFDVRSIYNIIISGTLFIIGPALIFYACRIERYRDPIPAIASLLSFATSLFWYRWAFKYGSMGFVTSTLFIPLNIVFAIKILREEVLTRRQWIFATISFSLMLCWSLTGLIFLPAIIFGLFKFPSLIKRKEVQKFIAALLIINVPWIVLFLSVSKVNTFMALHEKSHGTAEVASESQDETIAPPVITKKQPNAFVKGSAKKITPQIVLKNSRELFNPMNITVLIFGLFAVFFAFRKEWLTAIHVFWLLTLGLIVAPKLPQLELDRMIIILGFVLCIPAARLLSDATEILRHKKLGRVLVSIPLALILSGIGSVSGIIYNRSPEKYFFADSVYYELSKVIQNNAQGGRAVFAGFVLHELNQGHLAPLMQEAKTPLVASTLFHNVWRYTELMPAEYLRRGNIGFEDYFSRVNATLVIAHEKKWRTYFRAHPEQYTLLGIYGVFNVFKRKHLSNYILEGKGNIISQTSNSVTLTLDEPNALLSFQYFPFLKTNSSCQMTSKILEGNLSFIQLSNCPTQTPITINAKSGFSRLW